MQKQPFMARKIEEHIKKLENTTGAKKAAVIYVGEGPDGKPQYLDGMTGKFLPELPTNHVIVGRVHLDLKEI
jgi:uncharacterized protein (UPF0128 family)